MQDKASEKRFIIALFLSIFFHLLILLLIYALSKLTHTPPRLEKIDASNLLVLKRGHSQDPSKNKPGAPPVTRASKNNPTPIASNNTHTTMPTPDSTPKKNNPNQNAQKTPPKQEEKSKITQQKKQNNSKDKALQKYDKDYIDPKNLSLLSKQQMMALQMPQNSASQSLQDNKGLDPQTREEIDELYGDQFGDLGSAEKDFIKNNLRDIGRITQKYLQYPREAGYLGQDGENAIEFYLYPNGDISDLKIIKNSGSIILDKNTTKTIEIAYKDYPRPTTKTLIRIKVRYFLYR